MKSKILCFIPALPSEISLSTIRSIADQTTSVSAICILTKIAPKTLPFPAKISYVVNEWLKTVRLECFDYLLRVDADTVLPVNFIEVNLVGYPDVVGYGPAQLIKVSSFLKFMGGRFHPDHDDGYVIFKFKALGLNVKTIYTVQPMINRVSGKHRGCGWHVDQGVLHYRYGYDILYEHLIVLGKWGQYHPYGLFFLVGYWKALFSRKVLFDVGVLFRYKLLMNYRYPKRLLKFFKSDKYKVRLVRLIHG